METCVGQGCTQPPASKYFPPRRADILNKKECIPKSKKR